MGWRWIIFDRLGLKWSSDDYSWCLWHFTSQRQYERISTCLVPIDKANFRNRHFFTWIVFGQNVRKLISKVFLFRCYGGGDSAAFFNRLKSATSFGKLFSVQENSFSKLEDKINSVIRTFVFLHFYSTEETTTFRNLLMGESPCNDFWKYETFT